MRGIFTMRWFKRLGWYAAASVLRCSPLNRVLNSWRINGTRNCTSGGFLDSAILFYLAYGVLSFDG